MVLSYRIEQTALGETGVHINRGRRGLQIELAPDDARRGLDAIVAALVACCFCLRRARLHPCA